MKYNKNCVKRKITWEEKEKSPTRIKNEKKQSKIEKVSFIYACMLTKRKMQETKK